MFHDTLLQSFLKTKDVAPLMSKISNLFSFSSSIIVWVVALLPPSPPVNLMYMIKPIANKVKNL